jgi:hypothetical protein
MRLRCACLGVKIRAETGLATAVAAVQATIAAAASRATTAASAAAIEDATAVLAAGLQLIELPNAMTVAHVADTQSEVAFLYDEVFTHEVYTQHGVTLPTHGGGTVVDCGANIGLFSLYAAMAVDRGCQVKVIAFEPAPLTAAALRYNLSKFCTAATAVCVQCAIGSADSDDGELW